MRQILTIACLAILGVPGWAQEPGKKPWQFTDEERLAMRFEPVAMHAREQAAIAEGDPSPERGRDIVVGSLHPELLLPWELWRSLVNSVTASDPQARAGFRDAYAIRARELGTRLPGGEDFWRRIEDLAAPSLRSKEEQRSLSAQERVAHGAEKARLERRHLQEQTEACKMRVEALDLAREEFGRETFDRFLYEVVASDMGLFSADGQVSADHLRYLAGGCQ